VDRPSLEKLCHQELSAEELTKFLLGEQAFESEVEEQRDQTIWLCLAALWQRWFPENPSFEMLDHGMQSGYDLLQSQGEAVACRLWLDTWKDVLRVLDKGGFRTIEQFDSQFTGLQSLDNWIQDVESYLWNAGLDDRQFLTERILFCEETMKRFPAEGQHDLMAENQRRALAESYFELGQTEKAEALYRDWLETDPRWGWGWIGWADFYFFRSNKARNVHRCEQILKEGLSVVEVRDRDELLERLADLCYELGRNAEAKDWRQQISKQRENWTLLNTGSIGTASHSEISDPRLHPLSTIATLQREATSPEQKIGRKEPCPCGSGKKFKRCCGANG